ncbi:MAG: glycosyltransferase [Bacteroidota bacterium]
MQGNTRFTNKKRILLVNLSKIWGGGEKWFLTMGKALVHEGFPVTWIVYPGSPLEEKCKREKLPHVSLALRLLHLPFFLNFLTQKLREIGPDMVILNASQELKTVGLVAKELGIPHIIFRRGVSYPLRSHRFNKWMIKHVVTGFLANSQATYAAFVSAFPCVEHKPTLTLNNGIQYEEWVADVSPEPIPGRLGLVARLSQEKGIDRAILAMRRVKQEGISGELHILGKGPDEERLKLLTKESDLEDYVVFRGFSHDVRKELARCSLFIFTPKYGEGTSIALIEAMALSLPCIVMDTPAMKEVVIDGETGFVVPDGHSEVMGDKIIDLLTHDSKRNTMGKAAQIRAATYFNLPEIAKDLSNWIESL